MRAGRAPSPVQGEIPTNAADVYFLIQEIRKQGQEIKHQASRALERIQDVQTELSSIETRISAA